MPVLSKRKTLTYTCLLYSGFKLLKPWLRQNATGPHCAAGSLQIVKLATKRKPLYPYRPATGPGRVAMNTNKLQKCFIHVAELLQKPEFLFCFCTVNLGWNRTNFHVVRPRKRLVTGSVRTDCFWTEVYGLWENTNYCRGSSLRKHNCLRTNLTANPIPHSKIEFILSHLVLQHWQQRSYWNWILSHHFHVVHSMHCTWFSNPYSTHKRTVPLLYISVLITSYTLFYYTYRASFTFFSL